MSDGWDPRAVGAYNLLTDPVLEDGLAIARQPGLDWSDPNRPDPPGSEPAVWQFEYDRAVRLLEARGRLGTGDPAVDAGMRKR